MIIRQAWWVHVLFPLNWQGTEKQYYISYTIDKPCSRVTNIMNPDTRLILGLCPANERRHYFVTTYLIGWAQAETQPWDSSKYSYREWPSIGHRSHAKVSDRNRCRSEGFPLGEWGFIYLCFLPIWQYYLKKYIIPVYFKSVTAFQQSLSTSCFLLISNFHLIRFAIYCIYIMFWTIK